MKAVILCGGLGSRLEGLTENKQKCCIQLSKEHTALSLNIKGCLDFGIKDFTFLVHHRAEDVFQEVDRVLCKEDVRILYVDTYLGLKETLKVLPFWYYYVINGDTIRYNLVEELKKIKDYPVYDVVLCSLKMFKYGDSFNNISFGDKHFEAFKGKIKHTKMSSSFGHRWTPSGVYYINRSYEPKSFQSDAAGAESLLSSNCAFVPGSESWIDMGTPEGLEKAIKMVSGFYE